jgi:hypothetical protein
MYDDMTDHELLALGTTLVARNIPTPKPSEPLPEGGRRRLEGSGLDILSRRYEAVGVGPVAGGRLVLCAPDLFDGVLAELGLLRTGDPVFSLCYGAFGALHAVTRSGSEILVDPLVSDATVFEGAQDDDLQFQVTCATMVTSAVLGAQEPDGLRDLEGRHLFAAVRARLGPLRHGKCYAARNTRDPVERFRSGTFEIVDVAEHLLRRHAEEPFRLSAIPMP